MFVLEAGHVYALLTALAWSIGVVLFRRAGEQMPPIALNFFKNALALALLIPTLLLFGTPRAGSVPWMDVAFLGLSGAIGVGLADSLFFRSLNILGAARSAIVDCLYSPSVVVFSFFLLGERLTSAGALGATLVVGAVLVAGHGRWDQESARGSVLEGVLLGALSMAAMAVSIVGIKPILEREPVIWATTVRLAGGLVALALFSLPFREIRDSVRDAFRPREVWRFAVPGAVAGAYLALLFWIAGFKFAPAGEAAILNQTSTLIVVLLAALFLGEPLTRRRLVAVVLGFVGSLLAVS